VLAADAPEFGRSAMFAAMQWQFRPSSTIPPHWRKVVMPFSFVHPELSNVVIYPPNQLDQWSVPLREDFPLAESGNALPNVALVTFTVSDAGDPYAFKVLAVTDEKLREPVTKSLANWKFRPAIRDDAKVWSRYTTVMLFPEQIDLKLDASVSPSFAIGATTALPKAIKMAPVLLPESHLADRINHILLVHFSIDAHGRTEDIAVLASSAPDMNASVIETIAQWRFEPLKVDGKETASSSTIVLAFNPPGAAN
jgi:TonB family protein